ncbi:hypothetical protein INR49_025593 [Caranx melampygus]|nr:hypothetical protein INR49_025593 [Caranx melampygus]
MGVPLLRCWERSQIAERQTEKQEKEGGNGEERGAELKNNIGKERALSIPPLAPLTTSTCSVLLQFPHGLDQDVPRQSRSQQGPDELLLKGSQTARPGLDSPGFRVLGLNAAAVRSMAAALTLVPRASVLG